MTIRSSDLFGDDSDMNDEEDDTPYSSISSRGPIQANPAVRDFMLSRNSAPTSVLSPAQGVAPVEQDPLMAEFSKNQDKLNEFRNSQAERNLSSNLGLAAAQMAQGANAPKQNTQLYENIERQSQEALKGQESDLGLRSKVMQAIQNRNAKIAAGKEALDSRNLIAKMHSEDLASRNQERADLKASDKQNQAYGKTTQLLESMRGNPAVAQAEKDIYAADKAKSLANLYGDPNKLSMPQVRMLASEVAKIASGGVPSQHELEGITPSALTGRLSEIYSKFTNNPNPANAAAFIKQYQDYASALTKDAQKVIKDRYGRIIESQKGQITPDQQKSLTDLYVNGRFGGEAGPQQGSVSSSVEKAGIPTKVINGKTYEKVPGGWQEVK